MRSYSLSTEVDRTAWASRFLESEHGPFHCLMAGIAVSLSVAAMVLFWMERISTVNLHPISFTLECVIPALAVAGYCHWARFVKLRDGCFIVIWACLLFRLLQLPQYAAARSNLPFHDSLLVSADRLIGIDIGMIISWLHRHPGLERFSMWSYGLMPWMVFASLFISAMFGQVRRAKEFLLAIIVATVLGTVIQAAFPVLGPWVGFGFHPYWNQAWYAQELTALRSHALFVANPDYNCGLITFPSFHAALATFGVFALWPFRSLRVPAVLTAVLICTSAVTTGWHYAADVITGIVLAVIASALSRRLLRDPRKSKSARGWHRARLNCPDI